MVHCSLFIVHCSLFIVHCSLVHWFIVHCSLFIVHCSVVQLFSCSVVQFSCSVVSCQLSVVPHLSLPWPWARAEARPSRACSQRKVGRREFTRAHCQLAPTRTRHAHASKRTSECTHHARFIGGRRTKRYQESKIKNQEPRTKNPRTKIPDTDSAAHPGEPPSSVAAAADPPREGSSTS